MTEQPRKHITIEPPSEMVILAARHLDPTEGPVQVDTIVDTSTRSAITTVLRYIAKAHNSHTVADQRCERNPVSLVEGPRTVSHNANEPAASTPTESCGRKAGVLPHPPHKFMRGRTVRQCPGESSRPLPQEEPMTEQTTPSHRTGLRGEVAAALEAADYSGNMRRGDLADAVMPVLYREWPWLLAEAEEVAIDPEFQAQLKAAIKALGASETENAELRSRVATLEHVAASNKRHVQAIVPDLERAEAAIARVRALAEEWHAREQPHSLYAHDLRTALDGPAPTGTDTTQPEPVTVTDPEWLRQQYAAALYERERPPRDPEWPDAYPADREVFEAMADAVMRVRDRHVQQLRQRLELAAEWTPPPPGSIAERLPETMLDLIRDRLPDYLSTACQTADTLACAACYPGSGVPRPQYDEIREHAERLHERCRLNNKFTGQLCGCGCHPAGEQS